MKGRPCVICLLFAAALFVFGGVPYSNDYLSAWDSFAKREGGGENLLRWLRYEAGRVLEERQALLIKGAAKEAEEPVDFPDTPPFYGSLGFFITFMEGAKNRGCFGSFYHGSDEARWVLTEYLNGALRADPRSEPLFKEDLEKVKIVLTIAARPFPVFSLESVDISSYGVMVSAADGDLVFVPAEIKTHDRLRAVLGGQCEGLYAFKTVTIKE